MTCFNLASRWCGLLVQGQDAVELYDLMLSELCIAGVTALFESVCVSRRPIDQVEFSAQAPECHSSGVKNFLTT